MVEVIGLPGLVLLGVGGDTHYPGLSCGQIYFGGEEPSLREVGVGQSFTKVNNVRRRKIMIMIRIRIRTNYMI